MDILTVWKIVVEVMKVIWHRHKNGGFTGPVCTIPDSRRVV